MDLYSVPSGYPNPALRGDIVCHSSCYSHGIALSQNAEYGMPREYLKYLARGFSICLIYR